MRNKKLLKVSGLSVLALAGLAACNPVEARPADSYYYANILELDGIVNNTMSEIYDSVVVSGSTNSETILDNILYLYSTTIFGNFYAEGEGDVSLKNAVVNNDADALKAIADAYDVYEGEPDRVVALYEHIVGEIEDTFLGYISNADYTTRNYFDEEDFYDARIAEYYDLPEVESDAFGYKLVDGELRIEEGTHGYNDTLVGANAYYGDILDRYEPYIDQVVLPDIYRSLLVSQYLINENYRSLGLSYARKVDIISLANNGEAQYINATQNLMSAYASLVINAGLDAEKYGFEFLSSLYKGTYVSTGDTEADNLVSSIYAAAGWTTDTIDDDPLNPGNPATYYRQSSLGAIYADYKLLTESRFTDDSTIRGEFTNNGEYSPEIGFQIRYNELVAESHTTHGWYNSSDLPADTIPSDMQTRLFRMNVANEVDFNLDDQGNYLPNDEMDYGWYRGGNYYLIPANYETGDAAPYVVYSSGNWYIVKVEEAVKTAKLNDTSDQCYSEMPKHESDPLFLSEIARDVAYMRAGNDTYVSSSNQYFVEQMALSFHDDDVYDYFKTTFSGLYND